MKPGRENLALEEVQQLAKSGRILEDSIENSEIGQPNVSYSNKWREFVIQITNKDVGMYLSIRHLPFSIGSVFDKLEKSTGLVFTQEDRKLCYHRFSTKASSLGTIQSSDMEEVLSESALEIVLPIQEIRQLMRRHQFNDLEGSEVDPQSADRECDTYSFQQFAAVFADARVLSNTRARALGQSAQLRAMFPIDPEAIVKQIWDFFMLMLLLYCSFSVPYEIAFLDSSPPELDLFEILVRETPSAPPCTECRVCAIGGGERVAHAQRFPARLAICVLCRPSATQLLNLSPRQVDLLFMVDICLNFVTVQEGDGFLIRVGDPCVCA